MSQAQAQELFLWTKAHGTSNTRLPTSNERQISTVVLIRRWTFNVGCSMLNVSIPKTLSPCLAFQPSRDKWGMGVCHALFPGPALGAHPRGGCRFPDAILHGKWSFRPRSRAVQRLAVAEFRVRLFSPLGPMVAPPACEPSQDTPAFSFFAS